MKDKNKNAVIGVFTGKCCDGTVTNNNDMFLSTELFNNLFASDEYKAGIKNGHYIGFLGHPDDPGCMDFEHACIVMRECHIDDNGEVFGTFDLIDTPVGRIVKTFIDAGVNFGISIRGAGDVAGDGTVDPDTFVFRGFDLVAFPAYNDAIPAFQEIAASTSLDNQIKYKKVCAAINTNLASISSSTALDMIKAQFNENSDEYKKIVAHENELSNVDANSEQIQLLQDKVNGMTNLYLAQVAANSKMRQSLQDIRRESAHVTAGCLRKIKSMRRIVADQVNSVADELDNLSDKYDRVVTANSQLKAANSQLKAANKQLKADNLKYTHKIEASKKLLETKDSTISDLQAKLRKTVTASSKIEGRASNLDEEVNNLRTRVEAAEQMVFNYQQAYANMYANALGVYLNNLEITASTSVEELQKMITGGTNTANIAAAPSVDDVEEIYELSGDGDEDDQESDIVTI